MTNVISATPKGRRLSELDSLRGLAAMSVVLSHFASIWKIDAMSGSSLVAKRLFVYSVYPVAAGREAVILFFILSGFVLSIPAIDCRAQRYSVFVIRRIFRIYLPYLGALALAVLGDITFHGYIAHSIWLHGAWSDPVDWRLVGQHVMFIGHYDTTVFDLPIWSLVHEMRISLVFPMLCAIALALKPSRSLLLAFLISAVSLSLVYILSQDPTAVDCLVTLHYASLFIVGIYLARQKDYIAAVYDRYSRRAKVAIAFVSALLYVYAGSVWSAIVRETTHQNATYTADWLTALGAAGLIIFSLNSGACHKILLWRPVHTLGKMSYSVYLLHFIVLLIFLHLLSGRVSLFIIFALCLVVTILASLAFYHAVEKPSMELGRRLSASLTPTKGSKLLCDDGNPAG
jgi:peptidoglycan/LPS O-acetylase OafA/YrhL